MFDEIMRRRGALERTHLHLGRVALWAGVAVAAWLFIRELPSLVRYAKIEAM